MSVIDLQLEETALVSGDIDTEARGRLSRQSGELGLPRIPDEELCADFDEDCADLPDPSCGRTYLSCWLYDPEKGVCPYLLAQKKG